MNIVKKITQNVLLLRGVIFLGLTTLAFVGVWIYSLKYNSKPFTEPLLTKIQLRDKIEKLKNPNIYSFKQNEVTLEGFQENVIFDYTFDPGIQSTAEDLLAQYKPDLGVIVVMDATTGQILSMAGENRGFEVEDESLGSRTFPSASVFKVVTAAAAIEEQKANPYTLIPYSGRDHTLYKSQLKDHVGGWRRISSLKDAFAKSINTVFGRIGVFSVGKEPLKTFSSKFGYDESIPAEFPISMSHSANPEDSFELAEMASGYTQNNVMSPIHGAMIAAAVANDGVMMQPYFMNAAYLKSGKAIYHATPAVFSKVMTPETASEMRTMMKETVTAGTSRKVFRGFFKGKFSDLEVGGKTGHLTDRKLNGGIDWFVGFAQSHGRKIAVSVLTMHKKYWTVKSAYLARRAFETAFAPRKVVVR
jgi:cell division protein FtsI/penicillin-binding protein 2